ncbi:hypothetical protein [Mesorhizobium silamurunense]
MMSVGSGATVTEVAHRHVTRRRFTPDAVS